MQKRKKQIAEFFFSFFIFEKQKYPIKTRIFKNEKTIIKAITKRKNMKIRFLLTIIKNELKVR